MRSVETRLAVKLATQPESNSRRTLAISTLSERMGRPTARTSLHRRVDEGEHDVEVVDHEVEDDIDVEGARAERAEAVDLEEHRAGDDGQGGDDGGIEALEVADLDDAAGGAGGGDDVVGFRQGGGERLFDEQVHAALQQRLGDFGVMNGGDGDGGGVEVGGIQQLGDGAEGAGAVLGGEGLGAGGVGVDHGGEFDRAAVLLQLVINARVIAPECAGADDGDGKALLWRGGGHERGIVSDTAGIHHGGTEAAECQKLKANSSKPPPPSSRSPSARRDRDGVGLRRAA